MRWVVVFLVPVSLFVLVLVAEAQYPTPTPFPTATPYTTRAPTPSPTPASAPVTFTIDSPSLSCISLSSSGCSDVRQEAIQVIGMTRIGGLYASFKQCMSCPGGACFASVGRGSWADYQLQGDSGFALLVGYDNPPADCTQYQGGGASIWSRAYTGTLYVRWRLAGNWAVAGSSAPQMQAWGAQRIYIVARAVYFPERQPTPEPEPTPGLPPDWWENPGGGGIGGGLLPSFTLPISSIVSYDDIPGTCFVIPRGIDIPGAVEQAGAALGMQVPDGIFWLDQDLEVCLNRRVIRSIRPYPGSPNLATPAGIVAAAVMVAGVYIAIRRR